MKSLLIGFLFAVVAVQVMAIDEYTIRQVRDPVQLKARLDADFATVAAGVGVNAVTNGSVALSRAVVTATAAIQGVTYSVIDAAGATNSMVSPTNIVVTIVNGGLVVTNVVLTLQSN
jgi:hypothetical protein